jgi:hypothetical protein
MELLDSALRQTGPGSSSGGRFDLRLDHGKATLSKDCGQRDPASSQCVFAQAFHQCAKLEAASGAQWAAALRSNDGGGKLFSVSFVGESGIDVGGVYREALTEMVMDLHTPDFTLFALCPNGEHKINNNMDKFVPSPLSVSPLAISMFEFVGKLMGLSLRTKATLPFNFPSLVWKGVVGAALEESDLDAVDTTLCQALRKLEDPCLSEAEFAALLPEEDAFFTTAMAGGGSSSGAADSGGGGGAAAAIAAGGSSNVGGGPAAAVELMPGGAGRRVTFGSRVEFVTLLRHLKLHEVDRQLAAMRRGFHFVAPVRLLQLFTWQQLEELVAGKPDIDVEDLKRHTLYSGGNAQTPVIRYFWKTFEGLDQTERSAFIRFVWGRSRLPLRGRPWPTPFKITLLPCADTQLPSSHTCFFTLDLPSYSTEAICHKRLLTAINFGGGGILNA